MGLAGCSGTSTPKCLHDPIDGSSVAFAAFLLVVDHHWLDLEVSIARAASSLA
jgi:hypothetical protein